MNRSLWLIFRWPLVLALLSVAGLLTGLLGDGVWDLASWVLLGVPSVGGVGWLVWHAMLRGRKV